MACNIAWHGVVGRPADHVSGMARIEDGPDEGALGPHLLNGVSNGVVDKQLIDEAADKEGWKQKANKSSKSFMVSPVS